MTDADKRLTRVGVFYDGNFFFHVSAYYQYVHARHKRISIPGFHEFIRHHVAEVEGVDVRYCQIVDAHFFRGRLSARDADARQKLYVERVFDDILMNAGVVTHYLPVRRGSEKGIDVWLALEAFELAVYKRFNVLVIIAGDSDFIPLARKVNSLGTRVMVLGWDFKYTNEIGQEKETVTSIHLLDEVTYPVMMHQIIDDKTKQDDLLIKNLFADEKQVPPERTSKPSPQPAPAKTPSQATIPPTTTQPLTDADIHSGDIFRLHAGFGFIRSTKHPTNVFFHFRALSNKDFSNLKVGDRVQFSVHTGEKGPVADEVEVLN